ncbi:MAG: hypothetical protein ABIC91_01345 [Nanoarchaeota archaeon]|nr:hypothetical protein [Nanoarchaeota archaeon]MBU1029874.1 hypothetical protein [Nanoarchaeota archaeon]MBU1849276.1 hypothetical protein [Nanoarchaeota archaeon]
MRVSKIVLIIVIALVLATNVFSQSTVFEKIETTNSQPLITIKYSEYVTIIANLTRNNNQYPLNIDTSNNKIFFITPINHLQNGDYELSIIATDKLKNPQVSIQPITINAPYMNINILEPNLGVSNSTIFDVVVSTERSSECIYGFSRPTGPPYEFIMPYDFVNFGTAHFLYEVNKKNPNHEIQLISPSADADGKEKMIYVLCKDEFGIIHPGELYLAYDNTPPSLGVFITPSLVNDIELPWSELNISTSDRSICKLQDESFNIAQLNNFSAYKKNHRIILNYTNIASLKKNEGLFDKYEFIYNITCRSLAGLESKKNNNLVVVDFDPNFDINLKSPKEYTAQRQIYFEIETSVKTPSGCRIVGNYFSLSTTDNIHYGANLGELSEDDYSYEIICGSLLGDVAKQVSFIVDRTKPKNFTMTAKNPSCSLDKIQAEVSAVDELSGIKNYNYSLMKGGIIILDGEKESAGKINIITELEEDEFYTLNSIAYDYAGNFLEKSANIKAIPNTNILCDYEKPSSRITVIPTFEGSKVLVECSDSNSGCSETFTYKISDDEICNPIIIESYDAEIIISNSSYFCWNVFDLNNNNFSDKKFVEVVSVEEIYPNHCFNEEKDLEETGVDCGGVCPVCEEIGSGCINNSDCLTNSCDDITNTCVEPSCSNNYLDGEETDIDCGGDCNGCQIGEICALNSDCENNNRCVNNVCVNTTIDTDDDGVPDHLDICPDTSKNFMVDEDGCPTEILDEDEDGMPDFWEEENNLNPQDPTDAYEDPDNDGFENLKEYQHNTNPRDPNSYPEISETDDSDNDGMPNLWEEENNLDPQDPTDAYEDPDNDGYTNLEEYRAGTDPNDPNSKPIIDDPVKSKNLLPSILLIVGLVLVLGGGFYIGFTFIKNKNENNKNIPEIRVIDEKQKQPTTEASEKHVKKENLQHTKTELFKKKVLEKKENRTSFLKSFEDKKIDEKSVVADELSDIISSKKESVEKEEEETTDKPSKKEEFIDVSKLGKEDDFKNENVGSDVFERLGSITKEKDEGEEILKDKSVKEDDVDSDKIDKEFSKSIDKDLVISDLKPKTKENNKDEVEPLNISSEDVFEQLANIANSNQEAVKKSIDKEDISSKDMLSVFANLTSKKQIDTNVFKAILSQLLDKGKISKKTVTEILFEFMDEELLTKKEVSYLLRELNLVKK